MNPSEHLSLEQHAETMGNHAIPIGIWSGATQQGNHTNLTNQSPIGHYQTICEKTKVIGKKKLNKKMPDVCGICLLPHNMMETVKCNCKHDFGKKCLSAWILICKSSRKTITCPTCRQKVIVMTNFTKRKCLKKFKGVNDMSVE